MKHDFKEKTRIGEKKWLVRFSTVHGDFYFKND